MTPLEAAKWWRARGYWPVPVPHRQKKPIIDGWQTLRIDDDALAQFFDGREQNIGVLNGDESGSADVDCDALEAVTAARFLLSETGLGFGRESKPASHHFFKTDAPVPLKQYLDPVTHSMLVELRGRTSKGTCCQTVVPPSTHKETGERIRFEPGKDLRPANIDAPVLMREVARVAAAALLARYWPAAGHGRHSAMLALSGTLSRAGWPLEEAQTFCHAVYMSLGTHDPTATGRSDGEVRSSFERYAAGGAVTGIPTLLEHIDGKAVRTALEWLAIDARPAREPWERVGYSAHRLSAEPLRESPRPDAPTKDYPVRIAPGFTVNQDGVFKVVEGDDPKWICAPLHVIAYARTAEREEWGKLLQFKDLENVPHKWILPLSLLARDTAEFRSKLLSLGLRMSASKGTPDLLRQYLQMTEPETFALTVDRIGWNGGTFVLPDENIGPPNGEMILYQPAWEMSHRLRTAGTLDQWRDQVGRYCSKNSRLLFCVSCAAAAPLLYFFGEQSGGFHLVAATTVGKTTCLMVAGSFWGGGGQNGFVQSWLTTANALENTAEWHNHILLCLDELKLIDPEQASKVAYSLSNGQSKGRAGRDMRAHRRVEWQLLFLSTGELGLASHLQAVTTQKQRMYGGQEVRFCEIPAQVDDQGGAFEFSHEFEGPHAFQTFSEHLKAASRTYYIRESSRGR